ncbi:hypothetical protein JW756_07020 [Candidatus Woesearchaeota archaeon]|nr:hypothetical protein [Candidatus Woesearchaeota archaeon]
MVGIIIYTTKEKFQHKQNKRVRVAYWKFPAFPKRFDTDDIEEKVFFAYKGLIQGYFTSAEDFFTYEKPIPTTAVKFYPDSWTELEKKIPIKPFQGFKYADNVKGLDEVMLRSSSHE